MNKVLSVLAITALTFWLKPVNAQMGAGTLTITGSYGPTIQFSAGAPASSGGRTAAVSSTVTGAVATAPPLDAENFSASIDFGDLSRGDGNPVVASVGLRVRSNTSFRIVGAVTSFAADSLRYLGQDVTSADGGSFIRVWSAAPSSSGASAAPVSNFSVNPALSTGMTLAAFPRGALAPTATLIMSGPAASIGGGMQSSSNAVDVPVFFSVPSGYDLGPSENASQGSFAFSMQFGAFPSP